MKLWFHGGTIYVAHCSPCVFMITYISMSSPWLLFHQLHPPCFTLPAKTVTHTLLYLFIYPFFKRTKHMRNGLLNVTMAT